MSLSLNTVYDDAPDASVTQVKFGFQFKEQNLLLNRERTENLANCLRRFGFACDKVAGIPAAKGSAKNIVREPETQVEFLDSEDGIIDKASLDLLSALQKAEYMVINKDQKYEINKVDRLENDPAVAPDGPRLQKVTLPNRIKVTCPIKIYIKRQRINLSELDVKWTDTRTKKVISTDLKFIPGPEFADKEIQLELSASKESGLKAGTVSAKTKVIAWNPNDVFAENRLKNFPKSEDNIRIISFNTLAPKFCRRSVFCEVAYPYCTQEDLEWSTRYPLIAKEVNTLSPDIACFQEVQMSTYQDGDWNDLFPASEYHMTLKAKKTENAIGLAQEGCVMAIKKSRFEVIKRYDFCITEEILNDGIYGSDDWKQKPWGPQVEEILKRLGQIAQICVAKEKRSGRMFVISNTHLFFHPKADHIRLLQVSKMAEKMKKIIDETGAIPIMCGDFNSKPSSCGYRYLTGEDIPANDSIWEEACWYEWGQKTKVEEDAENEQVPSTKEEEEDNDSEKKRQKREGDGYGFKSPLDLKDSNPGVEWTNVICGFNGCLDYILVDKSIEVKQTLDIPPLEEITSQYMGLPCRAYGSDHLAIATDIYIPPQELIEA